MFVAVPVGRSDLDDNMEPELPGCIQPFAIVSPPEMEEPDQEDKPKDAVAMAPEQAVSVSKVKDESIPTGLVVPCLLQWIDDPRNSRGVCQYVPIIEKIVIPMQEAECSPTNASSPAFFVHTSIGKPHWPRLAKTHMIQIRGCPRIWIHKTSLTR